MISAKIIADSIANGVRLTTMELNYPRFIHSEFMTHRMFCLDGDSILEFDLPSGTSDRRYKRLFTMTLKEFAEKWFNGDSMGRSLRHRLSNMRIRQLNEQSKKIETCTIRDCVVSGEKEVFEIKAGGMKVAGSKDHRILTVDGWKRIEELAVGKDYIITRAFGKLDEDVVDPIRLKKFGDVWKSTWLNQIRQEKLEEQNFSCFDCGTELLIAPHDLHHIIPVYENEAKAFDFDNIVALCKDCHKERHRTQDWQGNTYLYGKPEKLTAIKSLGLKMTYDLEMDSEFENFVASGIIVHNSRNASSSRAIPVEKMLQQVRENPAMPVHWGKNQPGMQAEEECNSRVRLDWDYYNDCEVIGTREDAWKEAAQQACSTSHRLNFAGYHKQIVNRLLEPFQWIKVIVTATEWDNFFKLRLHHDAQPEIAALASSMRDALKYNNPRELSPGEWHLPYVFTDTQENGLWDYLDTDCPVFNYEKAIKCSIARCARVSYLNHDNSSPDINKDIALHDRLLEAGHMSPFEHIATPMPDNIYTDRFEFDCEWVKGITHIDRNNVYWSGNFKSWIQYRQLIGQI